MIKCVSLHLHKCTRHQLNGVFISTGLRSCEWNKFKLKSVLVNLSLCTGGSHIKRKTKAFGSIDWFAFEGKESRRNIYSRGQSVQ